MPDREAQYVGPVDIEHGQPVPLPQSGGEDDARLPTGGVTIGPLGPRIVRPREVPTPEIIGGVMEPLPTVPLSDLLDLSQPMPAASGEALTLAAPAHPAARPRLRRAGTGAADATEAIVFVVVRDGESRARLGHEAVAKLERRGVPARGPLVWPQPALEALAQVARETPGAEWLVLGVDVSAEAAQELSREVAATLQDFGPEGPRKIMPYSTRPGAVASACPPIGNLSIYTHIFVIEDAGTPPEVYDCLKQQVEAQRRTCPGAMPLDNIAAFWRVWNQPDSSVLCFVIAETLERAQEIVGCLNECAQNGTANCRC